MPEDWTMSKQDIEAHTISTHSMDTESTLHWCHDCRHVDFDDQGNTVCGSVAMAREKRP